MRNLLFISLFLFTLPSSLTFSQAISFLDEIRFGEDFHGGVTDSTGGSDCWGWTDANGVDYAIMGTHYGTHYVKVPEMTVIDSVFGAQLNDYWYHRDIKTWRNYAFIVGEMKGPECGMQVVDLSYLPDSVHHVTTFKTGLDSTSHNLSIDTANAKAYVLKTDYSGFRIIDISNPAVPIEIGFVNTTNIHDVYARNDTVWVAEGYNHAYSVWDCSDPSNGTSLGRIDDPNFGYCHNIWASPDGKHFATGEETANKTVKIWNAMVMSNITFEGEYIAPCSLVHNVHWMGDFLVTSHYQSGVTVVDVSDPTTPVEVGRYDNYPWGEEPNFRGCWGAFPFTQNGYIYGSTIEGRLTLLGFDPLGLAEEAKEKRRMLGSPYPNPSNGPVEFTLRMKSFGTAKVSIVDVTGTTVSILADGQFQKGETTLSWNPAKNVSQGIYFIHVESEEGTDSRSFVVE